MANPIILVVYDPGWVERFQILERRIAAVLGKMAATIEHVGSTAVPGLAAKPILDMDVLLASDADLPGAILSLGKLGYVHRGDLGVSGREAFRAPTNDFPHHLYVCPPGSTCFREHLAFRDYLRENPMEAKEYAQLKHALAAQFRDDRPAYNSGKSSFVAAILRKAQQRSM